MFRKLVSPLGVVVIGLVAIAAVSVTWLRGTALEIAGKAPSDRALKTEVNPVRW